MGAPCSDLRPRRPPCLHRLRRAGIIRLLRRDRRFAAACLLGLAALSVLALSLPRIWRVAPAAGGGVRLSLLDMAQSRALARTARLAEARGDHDAAHLAWRRAVARNPGNANAHRGHLRFLQSVPSPRPEDFLGAFRSSQWLVSLEPTNAPDVLLAAAVMERYDRPLVALELLAGLSPEPGGAVEQARARCHLAAGHWQAFSRAWTRHGGRWKTDPILALHQLAWEAVTDPRQDGIDAARGLRLAFGAEDDTGLTAARLLLVAALRTRRVDDAVLALEELDRRGAASATRHAQVWRALSAAGREDDARQRARRYRPGSADPPAAANYLAGLRTLGLFDEGLAFAAGNAQGYGTSISFWRAYFDLVEAAGDWTVLRQTSAQALALVSPRDALHAEALFAEYRAARGQGRTFHQARLATRLAALEVAEPVTMFRIAAALRRDGHAEGASALLGRLEASLGESAPYWNEVFAAGIEVQDLGALRRAVEAGQRLAPASPVWIQNRAALLLMTHEDPAQALRLTLEGLARQPNSPALLINHALALVANRRPDEAIRLLQRLAPDRLEPLAAANYFLALAEARAAEGRSADAAAFAARVDRARLFPSQRERLDRALLGGGSGPG